MAATRKIESRLTALSSLMNATASACPHNKDRPIIYAFGKPRNTVVRDKWRLVVCEGCDKELHELFGKKWSRPKGKREYY